MSGLLSAPPGGDQNRASELNAFAWTLFSLSTVVVAARVYSRLRLTRNFWYDDFFIVLSWALTLGFTILWTVLGQLGGCRHLYYLQMSPPQAVKASRVNWIARPFILYALATGKVSVALLIWRILCSSKWRKAFLLYGAMIASIVVCTITIIVIFVQCRPVAALWDPELVVMGKATCWPPQRQTHFSIFTGSYLAFLDLALALLPVTIMWNLQLSLGKKVGICAIMGLGVFACICACIKTSKLLELNARADITFITVTLWIWNANECNTVMIAACIPTLRPLFLIIFRRHGWQKYQRRHRYNPGTSDRNRNKRIRAISNPASDSITVIGHADNVGGWIELGSDPHDAHNGGQIVQTLEFDVTSHNKGDANHSDA